MNAPKVFIGGEGPDELGDLARHPSYRSDGPGLIAALLRRVRGDGWCIAGGVVWKHIRKYRSGDHRTPEERNVLGLALAAREAGCEAICFIRDRDRDPRREQDVEAGITAAQQMFPGLRVIGGMAIEELEAWVLALSGERQSEQLADAKEHLANSRGISTTAQMLCIVEAADLDRLPKDAGSLQRWLARARHALE
jgi:hypothetical protein